MPDYIQFFPSLRCNKSCSFCFNRGIASLGDMSVDDFTRMADRLSDAGIRELDILGGEPTIYPHLATLLELGRVRGFSFLMSSNGINVSALAGLMKRFDRATLTIGISLNDDLIDPALAALISAEKPVIKALSTRTRPVPPNLLAFLDTPGIEAYLIYMDALSADDLSTCNSFPSFRRLLANLHPHHKHLAPVHCGFIMDESMQSVRCPAGTGKMTVMPDGSVYPCYLLARSPAFRLGNILTDDIVQLRQNPVLDFFRNFEGTPCPRTTCDLRAECHGGCPAVSLLVRGSLEAPDPRCDPAD
jgi:radical SAM protein with 4Fe4S-binding SPASM domain